MNKKIKETLNKIISHALSDNEIMHLAYGLSTDQQVPNDGQIKFYTYSELKGRSYPTRGCAYIILY